MEFLGSIILVLIFWFVAWIYGKKCHREGYTEGWRERDNLFK